jgi:hypothetical protein
MLGQESIEIHAKHIQKKQYCCHNEAALSLLLQKLLAKAYISKKKGLVP